MVWCINKSDFENRLKIIKIFDVDEYSKKQFNKENTLSKYLVPYIYSDDLDLYAEKFLMKYYKEALETPIRISTSKLIERMELKRYDAPLPDDIFGRTYFNDSVEEVLDE